MIITIDGPSASGKSSLARALAKELFFYYLNTGLLYRACAYILTTEYNCDKETLKTIDYATVKNYFQEKPFFYSYDQIHKESILYQNQDITRFLKTSELDALSSTASTNMSIRQIVFDIQQSIALGHDLIVDGRDCGTVLFPYAKHKFYLTASLEIRAVRWQHDQAQLKNFYTLEESREHVRTRDNQDSSRKHAPLRIAEDAFVIDNSTFTFQQTLERIRSHINQTKQF